MLSKSSINLGTRTNEILGLQIRNNQSMIKIAITNSLPKTHPRHKKIRVTEIQRIKLESGGISTKSPRKKLMIITQNYPWWPRSKKRSLTLSQNLFQKIMEEYTSWTQTPLLLS
jgi:hypothetical protein